MTTPAAAAGGSAQERAASNRSAQERAARKACLIGDYARGVDILSDLFLDTRSATHIFNQGRCFEQNRRYEEAIGKFEEYLRLGGDSLNREDREIATKHIADCKEKLPPPALAPAATPGTAPFTETSPPVVIAPPPRPRSNGAGLRIGGIVVASVGAAALAAGVILNLKVNSMVDDMESNVAGYTSGKNSDRATYQTFGWVAYGVGAACVVGGAVMYGIGYGLGRKSRAGSSSNLALLPTLGPGLAGASLIGAFQ